jgi:phage shock protein PspC (stress-responsive transcriptional regulator)
VQGEGSVSKRLRRSRRQRWIAGVCGGLAERYGWRPAAVRALFVFGSLVPILPGFVVYLVLWLAIPSER